MVTSFINWTTIFEWYVARCGSKSGHENGIMRLKEIELCAQDLLTILGSLVINIIIEGDLYDHLMSLRILTSIMNE